MSVQGDQALAGTGEGLSVGMKIGAALEVVPILGPFLHAAAAALGALFGAIAGASKDTFHPTAQQAEAWLVMFRINPAWIFSGIDNTGDAHQGARLVRYFRLLSGEAPMQPGWELHNPNQDDHINPYEAVHDMSEPLTDEKVLEPLLAGYKKWLAAGSHPDDLPKMVPAIHRHPDDAQALLGLIRKFPNAFVELMTWSQASTRVPEVQAQIKAMRRLAGEDGPDPQLSSIFGVDVTVKRDPAVAAQLSPQGRVNAGLAGHRITLNGAPGTIDAAGGFIPDMLPVQPQPATPSLDGTTALAIGLGATVMCGLIGYAAYRTHQSHK